MIRNGMWIVLIVAMVEILGLVAIGSWIGPLPTVGIVAATSLLGAWLARKQGLAVLQLAKVQLENRELPGEAILDGICILLGGLLLLVPGFLTDIIGVLLLIPLTRGIIKLVAKQKLAAWIEKGRVNWIDRRHP